MSENYKEHISVLLNESIEILTESKSTSDIHLFADLTFGRGGHTFSLANKSDNYKLICTDQDPEAYENGIKLISKNNKAWQIDLEHTNFVNFKTLIDNKYKDVLLKYGGFSGILLDLGVSSHHFDSPERGFSFRFDGPLDMRMNIADQDLLTASDIINTYSEEELCHIFQKYADEKFASRIAQQIIEARKIKKLERTTELEKIIFHCYPKKFRHGRIHPATKVFQALRLEVNRELKVLEDIIPELLSLLSESGRLAIISFHSLEDRIVKHIFKETALKSPYTLITKKPIIPNEKEIKSNSRSRSAKLRVIERNI